MSHECMYNSKPVTREDEPGGLCSVDGLKVVDQEGMLLGGVLEIVFSAHHHHMNAAKVKSIPIGGGQLTGGGCGYVYCGECG